MEKVETDEAKKEIIDEESQPNNNGKKKQFTIFGFSITKILAYFVIYSVIGFVVETLFGLVTKGVLESRKSFLYGPFCAIYGVGAVVMIIGLKRFKKTIIPYSLVEF